MKAFGVVAGLALTLALPVMGTGQAAGATAYRGTVVDVIDGDSLTVDVDGVGEREIRLIGVDVPTGCGDSAEQYVESRLEEGDEVRLRIDKKNDESDDRLFAYVYEGGTFINLELIRRGSARVRTYGDFGVDQQYKSRFLDAQQDARDSDRGLWDDGEFVC